ncbi:hypothetical protein Tco_1237942 [Tanacetum coccineum]
MKRGFARNHVPLLLEMIEVAADDQGEGSEIPTDPHHTPVDPVPSTSSPPLIPPITEPPHSINTYVYSQTDFEDPPVSRYHIQMHYSQKLKELSELVPKLVMKIDSLEKELKETKQTFGHAVIKLVERVKSLEVPLKRKSRKVILSESEGQEPENQGRKIQDIDVDHLVSLARVSMNESSDVNTDLDIFSTTKERIKTTELNTGSSPVKSGDVEISTGKEVNTGETSVKSPSILQQVNVIIPYLDKGQREGKAQMTEEDIQATEKKRLQLKQERVGLEEAARLQAQMDAEVAQQIHMDKMVAKRMQEEEELSEQQKKRRDEVQEVAKYYSEED